MASSNIENFQNDRLVEEGQAISVVWCKGRNPRIIALQGMRSV
jgi:hypothetical protein